MLLLIEMFKRGHLVSAGREMSSSIKEDSDSQNVKLYVSQQILPAIWTKTD